MERQYTVWKFTSPSSGAVTIVAKPSEPGDLSVQHEYQEVLWQGMAASRPAAIWLYNRESLVNDAAEACELFGDDELERFVAGIVKASPRLAEEPRAHL
jgi:hypothetical protein